MSDPWQAWADYIKTQTAGSLGAVGSFTANWVKSSGSVAITAGELAFFQKGLANKAVFTDPSDNAERLHVGGIKQMFLGVEQDGDFKYIKSSKGQDQSVVMSFPTKSGSQGTCFVVATADKGAVPFGDLIKRCKDASVGIKAQIDPLP